MIDYEYRNLFLTDSTTKDLIITDGNLSVHDNRYFITNHTVIITNSILDEESFSLTQMLCSSEQIHYGEANASYIEFVMHENISGLRGKWLKVYMYLNGNVNTMLQLGKYKVDEDTLSADRTVRTIVAYDKLYDILNANVASWYNRVLPNSTSKMRLSEFRTSFLNEFGVEQEPITLVNDNIYIKRTISPETLNGSDVIRSICEMNGCFGRITNEGKFRYVVLDENIDSGLFPSEIVFPNNELYPSNPNPNTSEISKSYYTDVQFEDYMSNSITQLTIRENSEDAGTTVGTSGNLYIISDNFLMYGKTSGELTIIGNNILNNIKNRYYKPCTVNCIGDPTHELGDPIRIRTVYRGLVTYILNRSLTGIQALKDKYTAEGTEYFDEELNSITTQFKQLASRTVSLKVETDGITARVANIEDGSASIIQQLDNEISLCVAKEDIVSDLNTKMSGITITPNSIAVTSSGTFTVDSENFKLDSSGDCTLGSVTFENGEIEMTDGEGLSLFHGGIKVDGSYLDINGNTAGGGSSTFSDVAINGDTVHINYQGRITKLYNVTDIYESTSGAPHISMDDQDMYLSSSIIYVGRSGDDVYIKRKKVKWQTLTIDGNSYKVLVADE